VFDGEEVDFFARAPVLITLFFHTSHFTFKGRVNIIGEHVDYCGYPVLPMAIQNDVIFAVKLSPQSNEITLANYHDRFPKRTFPKVYNDIQIDKTKHEWSNYVMAGYKGVLENEKMKEAKENPVGYKALVWGTVPTGSGLSSSSALVCASALATLYANKKECILEKKTLAELCASCEQYIGIQSGG